MIEYRRSREGAWIEIYGAHGIGFDNYGRSREGAWIEIALTLATRLQAVVAPARERGLKLQSIIAAFAFSWSLPRGSVD